MLLGRLVLVTGAHLVVRPLHRPGAHLRGLVRFFEFIGGVPKVARTDRMGALGKSQGRRFLLHAPAAAFGQFHGVEIKACLPADAKRKGKVERPFRDVKEQF